MQRYVSVFLDIIIIEFISEESIFSSSRKRIKMENGAII